MKIVDHVLLIVLGLLISFIVSCNSDNSQSGQADTDAPTCYHTNSVISDAPFGINLDPLRSQQLGVGWDTIFTDVDYLRAGNPLYLRITLRSQWIQSGAQYDSQGNLTVYYDKSSGSYYEQVRAIYDRVKARGGSLKILGILYGTPWFNSVDGSQGPGVPIDSDVWEHFVQTMVTDFPDIHDWEIWNEPDLTISWTGTVAEFTSKIYNPAYQIIRSIRPSDTIIASAWAQNDEFGFFPSQENLFPMFGWNGTRDDYVPGKGDFEEYFSQIGGRNAFDVWGVHSYAHFSMVDENWSRIIQGYSCSWDIWIQTLSDSSISPFPLWITEIGINTDELNPEGYTEEEARDFLEYFFRDQILTYHPADDQGELDGPDPYITKVIVYELYDENPYNPEGSFLGLFRGIGQPKPAASMFRDLISEYYASL